jgi:hypothetical protein
MKVISIVTIITLDIPILIQLSCTNYTLKNIKILKVKNILNQFPFNKINKIPFHFFDFIIVTFRIITNFTLSKN